MELSLDNKIKKKLSDERSIRRNYGRLADKIIVRLSLLSAANNLEDIPNIPPTRRHKLSGNYEDCWGIDIEKNWRIVIKPCDLVQKEPIEINKIIILDIVDYH